MKIRSTLAVIFILISGMCYLIALIAPFLGVKTLTFYDGVPHDESELWYGTLIVFAAEPHIYLPNANEVITEWDEGNGRFLYLGGRLLALVLLLPPLFVWVRYFERHSSLNLGDLAVLLLLFIIVVLAVLTLLTPMSSEFFLGTSEFDSGAFW